MSIDEDGSVSSKITSVDIVEAVRWAVGSQLKIGEQSFSEAFLGPTVTP